MQRRADLPGLPIRLGPRATSLAGREELLTQLTEQLGGSTRRASPLVAALCGLGGVGKTSVAVEYAHRHLAEVAVAWQLPAEDPAVLVAQFGDLAAQLGAREIVDVRDPVASVHAVLARKEPGWLLILDNASDQASVMSFIPPAGNGRVLITTQNQQWPREQAIFVPALAHEVAAKFLSDRTNDPDEAAASGLACELDGLPLALEQAAAYMQATGTGLADYLALFRKRQADLMARGRVPGHPLDVAATLGLAMSRLESDAPEAAELLQMMAWLAPEPIPLNLLLAAPYGLLNSDTQVLIRSLLSDQLAVLDAIDSLRRYSLIALAPDGLVAVHRLVQATARARQPRENAIQRKGAAAALVEAAIPQDTGQPLMWPACAALLPHARTVLGLTSRGIWNIGRYLDSSGSYRAARELFRQITDAHFESPDFGPDHLDTLTACNGFANLTGQAGDPATARDLFTALLPDCERVLGSGHLRVLGIRGSLAAWTGQAGDPATARDLSAALLSDCERVLGPDHPETLSIRVNLATATGEAGDPATARDLSAALLPDYERVFGPDHPSTLAARGNLAAWTGQAGNSAAARDLLSALLPVRERVLGPDHPSTLATRSNLAASTGEAGDPATARDQYKELIFAYEKVLGPDHPSTINTRYNLAAWTGEAGDPAAGCHQLGALILVCDRILGPDHPSTLAIRSNLAHQTGQAGDPATARDLSAALLPVYERVLGPDHPGTLATRSGLAHWTGNAGDPATARDQFTTLLPAYERVLGPDHPSTLATRSNLAHWTETSARADAKRRR